MEYFEKLFKLIEQSKVSAIITCVIMITFYAIKIDLISKIKSIIEKKKNKRLEKDKVDKPSIKELITLNDSDIINHEFFNYIDFWVHSEIPTIQLKSEFRTSVFKDYLKLQFKAYKDVVYVFVNDDRYKLMDNSELRKTMLKVLTDVVFQYESKMRESRIPEIVINKMKSKNNDTLTLMIDLINSILDSNHYESKNNLLKIFSFMNILLAILENMMSHCVSVSNELNGELSGLSYNGYKEPKSKH